MCLEYLIEQCNNKEFNSAFIGMQNGQIHFHDLRDFDRMIDAEHQRPKNQWWLELKGIASLLAQQGPNDG
jgi:6-phosphofructokinase 1